MTARRRAGRGQSLVEFALVIPIFLLLLCAIIDGGRLVFAYNQMSQVTRAVARVASTACFVAMPGTPACDATTGPIAASIATQAAGYQTAVSWTVTCLSGVTGALRTTGADACRVGDVVRVSIAGSFTPITPIASSLGSIKVGSSTQQEILQ